MKKIYLPLLMLFAALLTGCATIFWSVIPNEKTITKINKASAEDQLYAVGRVVNDELLAQFPGSVALMGRNNVYVVVKGGDRFVEIVKKLNGQYLFLADEKGNKIKEKRSFNVTIKDHQFSGQSKFLYEKPKSELSDDEIKLIKSFGIYKIEENGSAFEVDFAGFVPKLPVRIQGDQTEFKFERKIVLNETQEQVSSIFNIEKLLILPMVIAIDFYTLPLQALILAVDRYK